MSVFCRVEAEINRGVIQIEVSTEHELGSCRKKVSGRNKRNSSERAAVRPSGPRFICEMERGYRLPSPL